MSEIFFGPDLLIYCDGGCAPNPGAGGWGVCAFARDHDRLLGGYSGGDPATTNNRMELEALRYALLYVAAYSPAELGDFLVEIRTDSRYALNRLDAAVGSSKHWKVNDDLRAPLRQAWSAAWRTGAHIRVQWVRGHNNEKGNELADKLATEGRSVV